MSELIGIGEGAMPVVGGSTTSVAEIVDACHERSIEEALASFGIAGLDRDTLDGVLTYCAEQRCEAAGAACPGCRRRALAEGIETLDDFVAAHRSIAVGAAVIAGRGERSARYATFADLEAAWAGIQYWYWARRVIRKLRHGIRRAHMQGEPVAAEGATPAIILMEPQLADNIGMVARAMANFGLDGLRLVAPRDGWPNDKARIAASGANYVIDDARAYATLGEASGDLNWLAATTARQRDLRKPVMTPAEAAAEMARRIGQGERCGVLFGRERNGLETAEVADADAIVMIPVNSRFASLNLAQAVLLLGYEWMRQSGGATLGRVTTYEEPLDAGLYLGDDRPATKDELAGLFTHLESELDRLGFFNPPHRQGVVSRNIRTMFTRMAPTEQEVRTLRGIVATLALGKGKGRKGSS
ncbi:MAG: RNA methyltransferase [Hyphomicrobiaceae bacterium]